MWEVPPRRVLLATDLSDASKAAMRWGRNLASRFESEVTVVHVEHVELPPYFRKEEHERLLAQMRRSRDDAVQRVREATRGELGFDPQVWVREGYPSDTVVRAAGELGADLILLGTHGRSGMRKLWLGSVAENVLGHSDRPAMAIRGDASGDPPEHVVCASDDPAVRDVAGRWADAWGVQLQTDEPGEGGPVCPVLYVVGSPPPRSLRRPGCGLLVVPAEEK